MKRGGAEYPTQWWRVAPYVRTGDQLQIGVDNSGGGSVVAVCLVSPVDEFGADAALGSCQKRERTILGRLDRIVLPHVGDSGQPFLVFYGGRANQGGGYWAVIERVFRVVKIGTGKPLVRIRRKFTYRAFVRYGDGTLAPNGTVGFLRWRRSGRNPGPGAFTTLASARSVKGRLRFKARLPKSTKKRVELQSCVTHPRGGLRCTEAESVKLRK